MDAGKCNPTPPPDNKSSGLSDGEIAGTLLFFSLIGPFVLFGGGGKDRGQDIIYLI